LSASTADDRKRSYGRGAAVAAVGIGLTGLVTQAYFSLASHALSKDDYGGISLLWTSIFLVCSILYRPVEQLLGRTIADRDARGIVGREHLRVAATIQLALALLFAVVALALRGPLEDDLFDGSTTLYWLLIAAVLAYAASYFARGFLAGNRWLGLYGALVFLESVARCTFALLAVLGVATGQGFVALGMAVAPAVSLIVVPWALGRHLRSTGCERSRATSPVPSGRHADDGEGRNRTGDPRTAEAADVAGLQEPPAEAEFTLAHGAGFAIAVLVIMVCEQAFLNAGPLLVKSTADAGGAALAGFAFNVVLIARAPLQLFQAIQTAILPHLTELSASAAVADFRRSVAVTVRAIAAFGALVTLALLAVGPFAMHVLFGDKGFDYKRFGLVAMGAGMGLYLVGATLNQAALARGRARDAAACWVGSAAAYVVFLLVPIIDDRIARLEVAYLFGAVVLSASLYWLYRRSVAEA
jgi:O-antigen/teichoic acid export membrane protein